MILATTDFTESTRSIQKKTNYYACFDKELQSAVSKNFSTNQSVIRFQTDTKILYKSRLKGCNSQGKSYGFRVLHLLDKVTNDTYLLYAYAKYGTYKTENVNDEFEMSLVQSLKESIDNADLYSLTFEKKGLRFEPYEIPAEVEEWAETTSIPDEEE